MNWIDRLNRMPRRLVMGQGSIEILHWAYSPHLIDNVPHRHTYFEICQVGDYGSGHFLVEGEKHSINPRDIFFARPGVVHQIVNTSQPLMELRWVCFAYVPPQDANITGQAETVNQLWRAFADAPLLVVPDDDERVAILWRALQSVADNGHALQAQVDGVASALLLAIAQSGSGAAGVLDVSPQQTDWNAHQARLAVRYIHDNLNRRLTIEEIAAQIHVSPRHLSRLFARFAGTSPAIYIERARLDRAASLLRDQSTSIKEVAIQVGYPDVHHFSRVFSRHFGTPPGRFRDGGSTRHVPIVHSPGLLV